MHRPIGTRPTCLLVAHRRSYESQGSNDWMCRSTSDHFQVWECCDIGRNRRVAIVEEHGPSAVMKNVHEEVSITPQRSCQRSLAPRIIVDAWNFQRGAPHGDAESETPSHACFAGSFTTPSQQVVAPPPPPSLNFHETLVPPPGPFRLG